MNLILPKDRCSGIAIFDNIDNNYIVLMGSKKSIKGRIFEYFGGHNEPEDDSALHTAIRELVEELFNVKISKININELTNNMLQQNDIRHEITLVHPNKNLTYFIGFETLEKIYNYLHFGKYQIIQHFDLIKYLKGRKINGNPKDGLNEIEKIHIYYLEDVAKLKLRNVSRRITEHLEKCTKKY